VTLGADPLIEGILRLARRARIDLGSEMPAVALEEEPTLTPREHEVLELVAAGRSNHQIAETLFISDQDRERPCVEHPAEAAGSPLAARRPLWRTVAVLVG
jgi:FixJ family two-component response regulator